MGWINSSFIPPERVKNMTRCSSEQVFIFSLSSLWIFRSTQTSPGPGSGLRHVLSQFLPVKHQNFKFFVVLHSRLFLFGFVLNCCQIILCEEQVEWTVDSTGLNPAVFLLWIYQSQEERR